MKSNPPPGYNNTAADWHILGPGCIGTCSAYYLQQAGFKVRLLHPTEPEKIERTLLKKGERYSLQLPNEYHIDRPIRNLVITTKAQQTAEALSPLLDRITPGATIICLQNGMGSLEDICWSVPIQFLEASTTNGAWRDQQIIHLVAENQTRIGFAHKQFGDAQHTDTIPHWFDLLQTWWPGLCWDKDIHFALLQKLSVNAIINPLTALYDCANGALFNIPEAQLQAIELAKETDSILSAQIPDWPNDTLHRAIQVAENTGNNLSSMLRDIQQGKTSEIDFINGYLVRIALKQKLKCSLNQSIVKRIHTLQDV